MAALLVGAITLICYGTVFLLILSDRTAGRYEALKARDAELERERRVILYP